MQQIIFPSESLRSERGGAKLIFVFRIFLCKLITLEQAAFLVKSVKLARFGQMSSLQISRSHSGSLICSTKWTSRQHLDQFIGKPPHWMKVWPFIFQAEVQRNRLQSTLYTAQYILHTLVTKHGPTDIQNALYNPRQNFCEHWIWMQVIVFPQRETGCILLPACICQTCIFENGCC